MRVVGISSDHQQTGLAAFNGSSALKRREVERGIKTENTQTTLQVGFYRTQLHTGGNNARTTNKRTQKLSTVYSKVVGSVNQTKPGCADE